MLVSLGVIVEVNMIDALETQNDADLLGEFAPIGGHAEIRPFFRSEAPSDHPSPRAMINTAPHNKIQRLKRASIFASTPDNVLAAVADALQEVQLAPNQQLFAKGDFGTSMYVLVAGLVWVHIGDQTVVEL